MAGTEVSPGSPLATALTVLVQSKVAEIGWSSGAGDDSALAQYIVLMLGNNKTKESITTELANDLLGLDPTDSTATQFVDWLFNEVVNLDAKLNGGATSVAQPQHDRASSSQPAQTLSQSDPPPTVDVAMEEDADGSTNNETHIPPTGPKSMRGSGGNPRGRDKRMLGHIKNAMDRSSDQSLHRIRGSAGTGRISRPVGEPPKGPKSMLRPSNAAPSFQNGANNVSPDQQMQLLKMLEEQSRMMAQILGPNAPAPAINPKFFGKGARPPGTGKSLFERVHRPRGHARSGSENKTGEDTDMTASGDHAAAAADDVPRTTICKFQLRCTSAACPYAHQSPAAPPGAEFDLDDKCPFGVACKNRKCSGSHPSPAQKLQHLSTKVDCKFYPNCTNNACPFRHPDVAPCKNGADCPERNQGCKYSHSAIVCRYTPCLNDNCRFKHAEGQKQSNVWKAPSTSERKFDSADGQEELILPGGMDESQSSQPAPGPPEPVQQDIIV